VSIRFLADADLDGTMARGVRRREPSIDFKSANDAGREGILDPEVLGLAAAEGRILVSDDTSTMPVHFAARARLGLKSPGVLLALQSADLGEVIESLLIIWLAPREEEWIDQIHYLPSLSRHVFR
jgi:predicted nuclease of predicted toxin-antitoxin system